MFKNYRPICVAICVSILVYSPACYSQIWTAGIPVTDTITSALFPVGGCYPNADEVVNIPALTVTGMQFAAIVVSCPANAVYVTPGNDTLAVGDTIPVTGSQLSFFCYGTAGAVSLNFVAYGTPTIVGQPYPCGVIPMWLSNLGICPETISNGLNSGCSVQPNVSAVNDHNSLGMQFEPPVAANNYMLKMISSSQITNVTIVGLDGRMAVAVNAHDLEKGISCAAFNQGIYFLQLATNTGLVTRKFVISK